MPLYMTQFSYTSEAWAAFVRSPEDRRTLLSEMLEKLGGRVLNLYYSFGEYDGVIIFEAPNETTAAAAVLAAITPGHLRASKTTVLLTVENAMEAMRQAGTLMYSGAK